MTITITPRRMAKKTNVRTKREKAVTFMATPAEKSQYESAGFETDQSMSDWIRKTLKAELQRMKAESAKQ